ncbi:MAG: hypothetical protein SGCHY_001377 [Lobulomycetales sp.]
MHFSHCLFFVALFAVSNASHTLKKRCAPKTLAATEPAMHAAAKPAVAAYAPQQEVKDTAVEVAPQEVAPQEEEKKVEVPAQVSKVPSGYQIVEDSLSVDSPTHFDDDNYQCYEWNQRAKTALKAGYKFAATNYQLCAPSGAPHKIQCGGSQYLCALTPNGEEYIIIDWCNPSGAESCTVHGRGHLDVLVGRESNNVDCVENCEPYKTFAAADSWKLVQCSFQINAEDFAIAAGTGDGSEYGR